MVVTNPLGYLLCLSGPVPFHRTFSSHGMTSSSGRHVNTEFLPWAAKADRKWGRGKEARRGVDKDSERKVEGRGEAHTA